MISTPAASQVSRMRFMPRVRGVVTCHHYVYMHLVGDLAVLLVHMHGDDGSNTGRGQVPDRLLGTGCAPSHVDHDAPRPPLLFPHEEHRTRTAKNRLLYSGMLFSMSSKSPKVAFWSSSSHFRCTKDCTQLSAGCDA